mmetsp:Transcript_26592/g.54405  ORF Transcript_26592/g.54405 Transcript_26592/m.54405 type:complete len:215 (-) Transcript_26592:363-1007(-)
MSHRLDHLAAQHPVEFSPILLPPRERPVVDHLKGYEVLQSLPLHPLGGEGHLFDRQGDAGDLAAVLARRVEGQSPPAEPDVQHGLTGLDLSPIQQGVELSPLRLLQRASEHQSLPGRRRRHRVVDGRGVHARLGVQERHEEVVAEVVVRPYVLATSAPLGVAHGEAVPYEVQQTADLGYEQAGGVGKGVGVGVHRGGTGGVGGEVRIVAVGDEE